MNQQGLFIGLVTLDLIYLVEAVPQSNQKMVAANCAIVAGGPATNAAVTFSYLGNAATVTGVVGCHPIGHLIRTDLNQWGVSIADLQPDQTKPPPTSSILVTEKTGDRAVVSLNATKTQALSSQAPAHLLPEMAIVLLDGHQMAVSVEMTRQATGLGIPVAVDGGSWKPGFEQVLPWVDYAVCSEDFQPPGCHDPGEVLTYLTTLGIPHVAVTRGERSILYCSQGNWGEISIPQIRPVDTLGAGDVFHGAFCDAILRSGFCEALAQAAIVAAHSCLAFGTRGWMTARS